MNGMLNIILVLITVIVAVMTYQAKFRARTLELEIHALHKKNIDLKSSLTVLRAEQSYLSRPERLERLSKKFLSLTPNETKRNITEAALLGGREDLEARQAAQKILEDMRLKDKNRAKKAISQQILLNVPVQPPALKKARPVQNPAPVMVMGVKQYHRDIEKPVRLKDNLSTPEPEIYSREPQPKKPKWTYHGGIGEDD